jgi:endonuclease G
VRIASPEYRPEHRPDHLEDISRSVADTRWSVVLLLAVVMSVIGVQAARAEGSLPLLSWHCLAGCPTGGGPGRIIVRRIYTLQNDAGTKVADWVAYAVIKDWIGPTAERHWRADPLLPADATLEPADYTGAYEALHTDRGHQVPLASFTGADGWEDTNVLSNITAQSSDLNRGPWLALESAERDVARSGAVVHVLSGPFHDGVPMTLPRADEPNRVPTGYWKIVMVAGEVAHLPAEVATFVFDQATPRDADMCADRHKGSIADVARRTGLTLLPELHETSRAALDAAPSTMRRRLGCAD